VARGSLGKAELTARRFISNPYKPEERLYRSGDLARATAEGEIEYIGRIDDQVQLMGFRIEPGEIESKLIKFDGIKESAVAIRERGEEKFLVAYYVSADEISASFLRNYLLDKLPEHMIPSYYVHMPQLPLTYNGKIDRKSLPDPKIELVEEYERPINEVQARLVAIWAEVLGLEERKIGVNTNFFDIGGNSIKLMKLVNKINQQFNTEIWVAKMFEFPVISLMAEYLRGDGPTNRDAEEGAGDVTQMIETVEFLNQMHK
jgi:acyl carrier protein